MNIAPEVDAMIQLEKERIEKIYGEEISEAVGDLIAGLMISITVHATVNKLSAAKLMRALSDTIFTINNLAVDYSKNTEKVQNN